MFSKTKKKHFQSKSTSTHIGFVKKNNKKFLNEVLLINSCENDKTWNENKQKHNTHKTQCCMSTKSLSKTTKKTKEKKDKKTTKNQRNSTRKTKKKKKRRNNGFKYNII